MVYGRVVFCQRVHVVESIQVGRSAVSEDAVDALVFHDDDDDVVEGPASGLCRERCLSEGRASAHSWKRGGQQYHKEDGHE